MKKKIYTYVFGYFSNSMGEKKKCILMFLGIFLIACVRKKYIYICIYVFFWCSSSRKKNRDIFFLYFPVAGNKMKKRKKIYAELSWATAQLYCDRRKCIARGVWWLTVCIAI